MFQWKDDYKVDIAVIDEQHQKLFAIGHELYEAMRRGQGRASLGLVLNELILYTKAHFVFEEGLMRLNGYPDLERHKAVHDTLTKQVLAFQADFQSGEGAVTVELLQFLKDWLEKHIKVTDMAYAPCLKQNGRGVLTTV